MKSHEVLERCFGWMLAISIGLAFFYSLYYESQQIPLEPFDQQFESIDGMTYEGPRSGQWVQVRAEFVRLHPRCEACGSAYNLNVHHIIPFHERPDLELDEGNLITLCREHHFRIGHDPDGNGPRKPSWLESNPNVRRDAANMRSKR